MQVDIAKFQVFFLKFKSQTCGLRDIVNIPDTENASI